MQKVLFYNYGDHFNFRYFVPNQTEEDNGSANFLKSYIQAADYGAYGGNCILKYGGIAECNIEKA